MDVKKITTLKAQGAPKSGVVNAKRKAVLAAQATGLLPHEWLLKVARGEPMEHFVGTRDVNTGEVIYEKMIIYPDYETRLDAAKAAAPFYAPRLATQNVNMKGTLGIGVLDPKSLRNMSSAELDNMVALLCKAMSSLESPD